MRRAEKTCKMRELSSFVVSIEYNPSMAVALSVHMLYVFKVSSTVLSLLLLGTVGSLYGGYSVRRHGYAVSHWISRGGLIENLRNSILYDLKWSVGTEMLSCYYGSCC